jgi:hypothetical protein
VAFGWSPSTPYACNEAGDGGVTKFGVGIIPGESESGDGTCPGRTLALAFALVLLDTFDAVVVSEPLAFSFGTDTFGGTVTVVMFGVVPKNQTVATRCNPLFGCASPFFVAKQPIESAINHPRPDLMKRKPGLIPLRFLFFTKENSPKPIAQFYPSNLFRLVFNLFSLFKSNGESN